MWLHASSCVLFLSKTLTFGARNARFVRLDGKGDAPPVVSYKKLCREYEDAARGRTGSGLLARTAVSFLPPWRWLLTVFCVASPQVSAPSTVQLRCVNPANLRCCAFR